MTNPVKKTSNKKNTIGTGVFLQDWEVKLQTRLDYPQNWKEVCNVIKTNTKYYNYPYMATVPAAVALTRDTAFTWTANAITNEQLDIATGYVANTHIDLADMAQCKYENQMEYADVFGKELNEAVESAVLADYTNWTDFDNGIVTANAEDNVNITVSDSNIDNIVGAMVN